jgi:hypothetical protein
MTRREVQTWFSQGFGFAAEEGGKDVAIVGFTVGDAFYAHSLMATDAFGMACLFQAITKEAREKGYREVKFHLEEDSPLHRLRRMNDLGNGIYSVNT